MCKVLQDYVAELREHEDSRVGIVKDAKDLGQIGREQIVEAQLLVLLRQWAHCYVWKARG